MPNSLDTNAIRRYYDENTRLFLRFAPSASLTIHRALWADGVDSHTRALNYSNELIRNEISKLVEARKLARVRLLDLGCGAGASLAYILPRLSMPTFGVGVTISEAQAHIARRYIAVAQADFQAIPFTPGFDAAYSIEAFCHATAPENYFAGVARVLAPAGRLILVDDFLGAPVANENEKQWLAAYQTGWHVPNIRTIETITALAQTFGLRVIEQRDLTPCLKLRALPDFPARIVRAIGERIPARHPIVPSMLGSLALQQCLKMGMVRYCFLVFEKIA